MIKRTLKFKGTFQTYMQINRCEKISNSLVLIKPVLPIVGQSMLVFLTFDISWETVVISRNGELGGSLRVEFSEKNVFEISAFTLEMEAISLKKIRDERMLS